MSLVRGASLRQSPWQPSFRAPPGLGQWLATAGSLTAKLKAHSDLFRVQCLHQRTARCLSDEAAAIGLHRPGRVWEREVLLKTLPPAICATRKTFHWQTWRQESASWRNPKAVPSSSFASPARVPTRQCAS